MDFISAPNLIGVKSATASSPPGSPNEFDIYLVPSGATGAWAGQANKFARYDGTSSSWKFITPTDNTLVWARDTGNVYPFNPSTGTFYAAIQPGSGGTTGVTVQEADGSPTVTGVTNLQVGNGDLTNLGSGSVRIKTAADATGGGSALSVQEIDGTPNVNPVTNIRVDNADLTDNGSGSVTIKTASSAVSNIRKAGTLVGSRKFLNLIEGSNITITATDDGGNNEVDVTIAASVPSNLNVQESDGTPTVTPVSSIKVGNSDLTDEGSGVVRIKTAADAVTDVQKNGSLISSRRTINLIEGSNVTLTVADNSGANKTDVTINSTGSGGGSVGSFDFYDPDKPPTSSSAYDDEFTATSIDGKWTQVNWSSINYDVNTTAYEGLWVENLGNGTSNPIIRCLLQSIPSGDFTIVTRVHVIGEWSSTFIPVHCMVLSTTNTSGTGSQVTHSLVTTATSTQSTTVSQFVTSIRTNFAATSSTIITEAVNHNDVILRIRRSGTNYFFGYSMDGITWRETTAQTLAFTPLYMGIGVSNASSSTSFKSQCVYRWFRYYNTATSATMGGVRSVGGDESKKSTYGSRAAASNNGNLFLPTDGIVIERDTGSAYESWGPLFPFNRPVLSQFTAINQGGATATEEKGGIYVSIPASSTENVRLWKKSLSGATWKRTIAITPLILKVQFHNCGLMLRESSSSKLIGLSIAADSLNNTLKIYVYKWDSATVFNAAYSGSIGLDVPQIVFLQIEDTGSNRVYRFSLDGQHYFDVLSTTDTDFLTPDECGFYVNSANATYGAGMTLYSWSEI